MTRRLVAAIQELLAVHRDTLRGLRGLDAACTGRWYAVNSGTTFSATLLVAAVPSTILLPPLGLGLAIAGGVAGAGSLGGDAMQERWSLATLKKQLLKDNWNFLVVTEMLK